MVTDLRVYQVITRGIEVAMLFTDLSALILTLPSEGYYLFTNNFAELLNGLAKPWVDLVLRAGSAVLVFMSNQKTKIAPIRYQTCLAWNHSYGPDIQLERGLFEHQLTCVFQQHQSLFAKVSLFEVLSCNKLFNGFGSLLCNEITERLHHYFGKLQ